MKITLTVTAGPAQGQIFTFDQPDCFLFGRARDAKVSLPDDPFVSRQHFLIEISPPNCKVTDLGSKNGTFVNGVRYGGRKPPKPGTQLAPQGVTSERLSDGAEITVGETRMNVRVEGAPQDETRTHFDENDEALQAGPSVPSQMLTVQEPQAPPARPKPSVPTQMPTVQEPPPARPSVPSQKATVQEPPPPSAKPVVPTQLPTVQEAPPPGALRSRAATVQESPFGKKGAPGQLPPADVPPPPPPPPQRPGTLETVAEAPPGTVQTADEKIDVKIPGYHIEGILGQGGMGLVYRGIEETSGRSVAIKMLLPKIQVSFNQFRSFHREIEVTRQLKHPNIVELIAHGKIKGSYYCVLEFVDGMDLRELMASRGGKVSLDEAIPIMLGVLDGLRYAHRAELKLRAEGRTKSYHGVVHRDLKPENIFLARHRQGWIPKVADFGISKSFESAGMTDMTMGDGVCGTPVYWPREQITHYRYLDPATDVFSIASVFYETLSGEWARPGLLKLYEERHTQNRSPDLADFMRVIGSNPIMSIRTVMPSIPAAVAEVFDRAMQEIETPSDEKEMRKQLKAARYADAGAFSEALSSALRFSGYNVPKQVY